MKVHTHIIMIYLILVGMCIIFYQRQGIVSVIEAKDAQTDQRFANEIAVLRSSLDHIHNEHQQMLISVKSNEDEDRHLREEIHTTMQRLHLFEKRQLAAMEFCKKERMNK